MNRFTLFRLAGGVLLAALAVGAQAAEATKRTAIVKGRAPVASSVVISNKTQPGVQPKVGNVLQPSYSFSDADGDAQSGSTIQWRRAGVAIASGATYTTQAADAHQNLTVQVTPRTSSATTEPAAGTAVMSAAVMVKTVAKDFGNFLGPNTQSVTWAVANNQCSSLGGRLPTVAELQKLFVDATSSPAFSPNAGYITNSEMCSVRSWPLNGQCGGTTTVYWTSEVSQASGQYMGVNLHHGGAGSYWASGTPQQVACVR